jgi:NADPH-dependent glutamate synthase beta subunit-like oxidoreductase/Pyruvate/2-oxoacid:ferredoxin oxidoreductase delta subunit
MAADSQSPDLSISFAGDESVELPLHQVEASPCAVACPAGVQVKSYVTLISAGRFREALEVVRERNPFPGICGRVCTHPCEESCNRGDTDDPLAIRQLKRFIADWEIQNPAEAKPEKLEPKFEEKVAVIGSGPAGLTAAADLARTGYAVTIFEALGKPGGMMIAGIPEFRLPRDILAAEIKAVEDLGVEIRTNTPIGPDLTIDDLKAEGYKAFFLAVGAHKGRKLGIPGEDTGYDGVEFLREANLGKAKKPGDQVVVVGGGNSAIDAARTSLRLGSKKVTIVYRRTRAEMPADVGEIDETLEEDIEIHFLASPLEVVLDKKGKVTGMKVIQNELGEPDESGRRRPVPIEGSEFVVPCDRVIAAISQSPDLSFLPEDHGMTITRWNTFEVDEKSFMTNVPGLFSGGDAWAGPASVIDAIRDGHRAAVGIHAYLRDEPIVEVEARKGARPGDREIRRRYDEIEEMTRLRTRHADPKHRRKTFDEVEQAYTQEQAIAEAMRCLHCGPCTECNTCVTTCDRKLYVAQDEEGEEYFIRVPMGTAAYEKARSHLEALLTRTGASGEEGSQKVQLEPVTSFVLEELCRGCGDCADVCDYDAPHLVEKHGRQVSEIDEELCRGCGTCAALCPSAAIVARHFTDDWVEKKLKEALLG